MPYVVPQGQWGICGFVCALNGVLNCRDLTNKDGTKVSQGMIDHRIGPTISTWLTWLTAPEKDAHVTAEKTAVAKAIGAFTASFGHPYDAYDTVPKMITKIKADVRAGKSLAQAQQEGFGVALPLDALAYYVTTDLKLKATAYTSSPVEALSVDNLKKHTNTIVGVGNNKLEHWVYVNSHGLLMNWSEWFDLAQAGSGPNQGGAGVAQLTGQGLTHIVCGVRLG